ncbi:hypothetical protein [Petrocella sp. FN5]|uniref:hypothetical protein n=1 Tax=Petrocella sp. FN5 TaxID=3032002 RepID=UPI0023DA5986|nr:hypothetical protein [Petrocella sp. FN5]MDF1618651.1 hypothetical protein [Petrocella sp. FN5]
MKQDYKKKDNDSYIIILLALLVSMTIGLILLGFSFSYLYGEDLNIIKILKSSKDVVIVVLVYSISFAAIVKFTNIFGDLSVGKSILIIISILIVGTTVHTSIFKIFQGWFVRSASDFFTDVFYNIVFGGLPIVLGVVIIKPWRRFVNFFLSVIYVPIAGYTILFWGLITTGVIFDDWL